MSRRRKRKTPERVPQERPGRIQYLYLTPIQAVAKRTLDDAADELPARIRLRCRNPELIVKNGKEILYYPHMDYDERTPPDPITALRMCTTKGRLCPVAEECFNYASLLEASTGVWGGHAFIDGKPTGITNNQEVQND